MLDLETDFDHHTGQVSAADMSYTDQEGIMSEIHDGQCGLCTHFGEGETSEKLITIRSSHEAPESLVEICGHPQLIPLHLMVTPISGCSGFHAAA